MRDIKYRACYRKGHGEQRMFAVNEWIEMKENWVHINGEFASTDLHIMQYTGLKDKNGKAIYEGDIVKSPSADNQMVVEYREIMASDDMTAPGIGFQFSTEPGNMEIIGNVCQNPDLL